MPFSHIKDFRNVKANRTWKLILMFISALVIVLYVDRLVRTDTIDIGGWYCREWLVGSSHSIRWSVVKTKKLCFFLCVLVFWNLNVVTLFWYENNVDGLKWIEMFSWNSVWCVYSVIVYTLWVVVTFTKNQMSVKRWNSFDPINWKLLLSFCFLVFFCFVSSHLFERMNCFSISIKMNITILKIWSQNIMTHNVSNTRWNSNTFKNSSNSCWIRNDSPPIGPVHYPFIIMTF